MVTTCTVGDAVAHWLAHWTPDQADSPNSGFEPWPGSLCCVLWQDTLLSQCLLFTQEKMGTGNKMLVACEQALIHAMSVDRDRDVRRLKCLRVTCNGLASHPVAILLVAFMLQKPGSAPALSKCSFTTCTFGEFSLKLFYWSIPFVFFVFSAWQGWHNSTCSLFLESCVPSFVCIL